MDKQLQEYDANVGFRCGGITVNIDDMVRSIDFDCVAHALVFSWRFNLLLCLQVL